MLTFPSTLLYLFLCNCLIINTVQARATSKEFDDVVKEDEAKKTPFTLEEYFNGSFSASGFNGSWLTDTEILYKATDGHFYKFDVATKEKHLFLNESFLANYSGSAISVSPDQSFILIRYDLSSVFRHSITARYAVYDTATEDYYDINNKNRVQLAKFDTTGHGFAYVYQNNIYYVDNVLNMDKPTKVTEDGIEGVVYNGVPDWVYEEEVLGTGSALWFSPDGEKLAYAQFNDTNVEELSYFIYGKPGDINDQYPQVGTIKYPKVGTTNPIVNTYVFNLKTKRTHKFNLVDSIHNTEEQNDYVLYDLSWVSNTEVVMISTNRVQNESIIIRCGLDGLCKEEVSYRQEGGWLSPKIPLYKQGNVRLEILPQPEGDDYFNHLGLTDVDANTSTRLTYGRRTITAIYGWDQNRNVVYYSGTLNDSATQQHVYAINTSTSIDSCLSCGNIGAGNCSYATASFSKAYSYYVKTCSGPNPAFVVMQNAIDPEDVFIWNENRDLRERLQNKLRFTTRDLVVPVANGFTANVRLYLPPDFDETHKYNALVYVYGGPNADIILDSYSSGIINYFVTNRKYIYIMIDGRGSGRDGQNKMFQIYKKMGTVEIEDQITVTKYLHKEHPYIDSNNTGIWGWSYGGFASTWALVQDTENVFKFAFSVAPVTSFIYYDSIYTERYMGLPTEEDNLVGYNNTDITRRVEGIRGKLYCIIHGNADDNVHYQQAMVLVKALEEADIDFRQQSYPDENHSLSGVSKHLYHTMDKFFARAFGIEGPPLKPF